MRRSSRYSSRAGTRNARARANQLPSSHITVQPMRSCIAIIRPICWQKAMAPTMPSNSATLRTMISARWRRVAMVVGLEAGSDAMAASFGGAPRAAAFNVSVPEQVALGEHALVLEIFQRLIDAAEDLRRGLGDEWRGILLRL